jgi:PKD repeat protein
MKYLLFIVLLVVVVITAGCVGGNQKTAITPATNPVVTSTPTNQSIAMFGVSAYWGTAPLTVRFFNHASEAESYIWDFGDGSTSSLYSPSHTYTNAGKYEVTLLATNAIGWTKPSVIITVETLQPTNAQDIPTKSNSPNKVPLYSGGDLITDNNDISKGKWVILNYNQETDQYELDLINKNPDNTWGVRIHESSTFKNREIVEKSLPFKFGHVNADQIKIDIHSYDNYFQSDVKTSLTEVNNDLRYHSIGDLKTDGNTLKKVANSEYLKFNSLDEYAKYLFLVAKLGNDLNIWGTSYRENQKNVALAYADNSLKDIQDIDSALNKMKQSDRYYSFSESIEEDRTFFEGMKDNIMGAKDYTDYWMR